MPICAIGEIKQHPDGKWYQKRDLLLQEIAIRGCVPMESDDEQG